MERTMSGLTRVIACRLLEFRGALLATLNMATILALLITVAVYTTTDQPSTDPPLLALLYAVVNFVVAWFGLAIVYCLLGSPNAERVNTESHATLKDAIVSLRAALRRLCPDKSAGRDDDNDACSHDHDEHFELRTFERTLRKDLDLPGPQWTLGYGYINLLRRAHRAEEALILVEDPAIVIAGARYDSLRITESTLSNRTELKCNLDGAVHIL